MKKFLLSTILLVFVIVSQAQIYLNEVYVQPNTQNHEFIELYNSSLAPANIGCYSIVTYFHDGTDRGLYVIDLPDMMLGGHGYLVVAPDSPYINYQGGQAHADVNWNDGNISRYVYNGTSLQLNNTGAPYFDVMRKSGGTTGTKKAIYAVMLFNGSTLVDVLFGASVNIVVPSFISDLGTLTHTSTQGCGTFTYNFANMSSEPNSIFGNVHPNAGTDNGYHRVGNGPCPTTDNWEKSSSPSEHTPGMPNPGQMVNGTGTKLGLNAQCEINGTSIMYNITGGAASVYPVSVTLYADLNANGVYDTGETQLDQENYAYNAGVQYLTKNAGGEFYVIQVDAPNICLDLSVAVQCQAGIVLPVKFSSFNARRMGSTVALTWETSTEVDNTGFEVQRKIGNNDWEVISFVPTRADNGNSNSTLAYSFNDLNDFKGISQYRLRQLDIDGRASFSEIRSVRGQNQNAEVIVYPNPSDNGIVNIVFDGSDGPHDISLSDMAGRVIRQWNNLNNNNLQINNLAPGIYNVRIYNKISGEQTVEKFVVSNR